ncbi:MAG: DUF3800 domain-containing protein [Candidatus Hydrogenedentota bacterium]
MTGGNASSSGDPSVLRCFVDEAGDPVLFDRKGRVRVGVEGCSRYFMMGKLYVANLGDLNRRLEGLRTDLLADPYFKDVPSMQPERRKTAIAFHAKDDLAEVRREVFRLLRQCELRFYAVVREKTALAQAVKLRNEREPDYRYRENEQYDALVSELFRQHHVADESYVCFAKRGARNRTAALHRALDLAKAEFARSFGYDMKGEFRIECSAPARQAGLQAVDYFLWALQRYYERAESRFIEFIWPQVGEVHDLDKLEKGRVGVIYSKKKPLVGGDAGAK